MPPGLTPTTDRPGATGPSPPASPRLLRLERHEARDSSLPATGPSTCVSHGPIRLERHGAADSFLWVLPGGFAPAPSVSNGAWCETLSRYFAGPSWGRSLPQSVANCTNGDRLSFALPTPGEAGGTRHRARPSGLSATPRWPGRFPRRRVGYGRCRGVASPIDLSPSPDRLYTLPIGRGGLARLPLTAKG
jgi:hypothetical protein